MYTARIRMPRMGTSVHESTVVAWKKAVGDTVAKGEVLLSAESDKVEFEVEAPADGVITEILAEAEETVPVGEVLATMETETEVADETPEPEEPGIGRERLGRPGRSAQAQGKTRHSRGACGKNIPLIA